MAYAPPEIVTRAVLDYLAKKTPSAHHPPQLQSEPRVVQRPWSTLYFFTIQLSGQSRKLVAKIVRFVDQVNAEASWQSDNLLRRGRQEFETATNVYNHFAAQPNPLLRTLHPVAYLPEINATVMDFSEGTRMNEYVTVSRLMSTGSQNQTLRLMTHAGQWLRCLHSMPSPNPPAGTEFLPADTFQALETNIATLRNYGIALPTGAIQKALSALRFVAPHPRVWSHGDFITGNFLVFPDEGVLGLDVVMDRLDSPYYDLGRFVGDLNTRRSFILRWGWLPSASLMNSLRAAFLNGYFNNAQPDKDHLALYEGYFIFREWADTVAYLQSKFTGNKALAGSTINRTVVNPAFRRIVTAWAATVTGANEAVS